MTWMLLWEIVFLVTTGCFAVMAVIVTIGGVFDIRRLFQKLRDDRDE
jgi:hypothetical protein